MGRIRLLDEGLINRISAGEVVERPASVVKELVENALDAGAGSVEVHLASGGKQRIRVTDDGCGMDRDDALLAIERHATSKLEHARDLAAIRTLGFRGEALSTIAAVSRFTLSTAATDGEGTEVEVHGGRIQAVREVGVPRGTTITADRLFFNTPARRKFLRSENTELAHCLRWLTRYALAHPSRRFRLTNGERRLLDVAPSPDQAQRIVQIHGADFAEKLLAFEHSADDVRVSGFAGRPVDALPRRDAQHLFVNGRAVQDRVLNHAVSAAYGNTMPPGRYPALFLFIGLDPRQVDVNVHPQKTEIRFQQASRVHDLVRDALGGALSQQAAVPTLSQLRPAALPGSPQNGVREATSRYLASAPTGARDERGMARGRPMNGFGAPGEAASPAAPTQAGLVDAVAGEEPPRSAVPLVQFRDSYIVAEDADGLVLVDQHAAHERVLFERYLQEAEANQVECQRLMFPLTLELAPHEWVVMEEEAEEFRRLGFTIEPFGDSAVRVDAVPALAVDLDPEGFLRELLGEARQSRSAASDVAKLRRRLVTTAACQAAIKINYPLTGPGMQKLLDDLYATANPTTCPHGRPILFRLTLEEIERTFHRR